MVTERVGLGLGLGLSSGPEYCAEAVGPHTLLSQYLSDLHPGVLMGSGEVKIGFNDR